MNTSPNIHLGPGSGMSIPIIANRHMLFACITTSLPGTVYSVPSISNATSGIDDTLSQSIVYSPMTFALAPTASAIFRTSEDGPTRREVPESTMPVVLPAEYRSPTETPSSAICQYVARSRSTYLRSPSNLSGSYPPMVSSPSPSSPRKNANTGSLTKPCSTALPNPVVPPIAMDSNAKPKIPSKWPITYPTPIPFASSTSANLCDGTAMSLASVTVSLENIPVTLPDPYWIAKSAPSAS
mmetsp:Transcript_7211/g.15233  ORF Transcript_7211/g.15233 Transcript_7211/m.15233 type:complete len:240 (-) Transcript_7211:366-1085(-)